MVRWGIADFIINLPLLFDSYTHVDVTLIKINIKVEKIYLTMAGPLQLFISFCHDPVTHPRKSLP